MIRILLDMPYENLRSTGPQAAVSFSRLQAALAGLVEGKTQLGTFK